jgi:hypothetical protein
MLLDLSSDYKDGVSSGTKREGDVHMPPLWAWDCLIVSFRFSRKARFQHLESRTISIHHGENGKSCYNHPGYSEEPPLILSQIGSHKLCQNNKRNANGHNRGVHLRSIIHPVPIFLNPLSCFPSLYFKLLLVNELGVW